jgi:hypothetical protein
MAEAGPLHDTYDAEKQLTKAPREVVESLVQPEAE